MDRARWQRVRQLFAAAREVLPESRSAYLREHGGGDAELVDEVSALLGEAERLTRFLSTRGLEPSAHATCERIGAYRILGVLGRGGMGVVYLAEQDNPRREVALKVIASSFASPSAVRRFEHEAAVLARLQHPGIAQIFEAGITADGERREPFFAMERIEGVSLAEWAREHAPALAQRLTLFAELCDAVQHAHQKGVIHRDLKPANVLVDAGGHPKVLDFGIARLIDDDARTTTLRTQAGELVGTLAYMSPEQAAGDGRDVDTQSDVYALGVMLYELLTGRLPHEIEGRSLPEALRTIREDDAPRLSLHARELRGDLEAIAAKALEKARSRRYASAADLAADVRSYLRDEPIRARPPSALYQLSKFTRRNRTLVGGVAAVFVALVAGLIGTTSQYVRARDAAAEEHEQRRTAERANARAQRRFEQVHELAQKVIYDFHGWIANLPGSTSAREFLVTTGLEYLDGLATEAGDDRELLRDQILGYLRIATIQGGSTTANLGDHLGAQASAERALDLAVRLTSLDPGDLELRVLEADARDILGDALFEQDQIERARALWEQSLEVRRELVCRDAERVDRMHALLATLTRLASAHSVLEEFEQALEIELEALALAREMVSVAPADELARMDLALMHGKVADRLVRLGRPAEALDHLAIAHEARKRMLAADATNVLIQRDLWADHATHAAAFLALGRHASALEHAGAALAIAEARSAADAVDVEVRHELILTHELVGQAHSSAGNDVARSAPERLDSWRAARQSYLRARAILDALEAERTASQLTLGEGDYIEGLLAECEWSLAQLEEELASTAAPADR